MSRLSYTHEEITEACPFKSEHICQTYVMSFCKLPKLGSVNMSAFYSSSSLSTSLLGWMDFSEAGQG